MKSFVIFIYYVRSKLLKSFKIKFSMVFRTPNMIIDMFFINRTFVANQIPDWFIFIVNSVNFFISNCLLAILADIIRLSCFKVEAVMHFVVFVTMIAVLEVFNLLKCNIFDEFVIECFFCWQSFVNFFGKKWLDKSLAYFI